MNPDHLIPEPPDGVKQIILDLAIDHNDGVRPLAVRPEGVGVARGWARRIWLAPDVRRGHDALVAKHFPNAADAAGPLEAEREVEVTLAGPDALSEAELAQVLLSRRAVADLDRLALQLVPDWWMDAMAEDGRELAEELGLEIGPVTEEEELADLLASARQMSAGPASLERAGPAVWAVTFAGPDGGRLRRAIAAVAFGDAAKAFELRLHRLSDGRAELEMAPPPLKADVTLPARFKTGEERAFVIPVPAEAKVPGVATEDVRDSTRSDPCEPLPAEAFEINGIEVREQGGLPQLWMRGWLVGSAGPAGSVSSRPPAPRRSAA